MGGARFNPRSWHQASMPETEQLFTVQPRSLHDSSWSYALQCTVARAFPVGMSRGLWGPLCNGGTRGPPQESSRAPAELATDCRSR
eukprot:4950658-Pyramimonas_sp.AAC.1